MSTRPSGHVAPMATRGDPPLLGLEWSILTIGGHWHVACLSLARYSKMRVEASFDGIGIYNFWTLSALGDQDTGILDSTSVYFRAHACGAGGGCTNLGPYTPWLFYSAA